MAKAKRSGFKAKAAKPSAKKASRSGAGGGRKGDDALYVEQVRQLVAMMVENDLTTLEIVNDDLKVSLGRGGPIAPAAPVAIPTAQPVAAAPAAAAAPKAEEPEKPQEDLLEVVSPMVGTFYAAPSPDSGPFVKQGDRVGPDTVVCIVEAMKVMNEIKAECSGVIAEIAVENGQPVEFGQTLFKVRP